MNKHKVMLDMAKDRIIFVPGRFEHDGAQIANLPPKLQQSESQFDDILHAAASSTFLIKQIEVAALAVVTTPSTSVAPVIPPFKIKKKKPKWNTEIAKLPQSRKTGS